MAHCVNCGTEADVPVLVTYGDPAHRDKHQDPFAVCEACFERDRKLTVQVYEPPSEPGGDERLVEQTITRYRKAR